MNYALKTTILVIAIEFLGGIGRLVAADNQLVEAGLNVGGRIAAVYAGAVARSIIHELGHAVAGLSVGIKPEHMCIGTHIPHDQKALISEKYITVCLSLFPGSGGAVLFPKTKIQNYKRSFISIAGPLAGLISTALAWQFFKDNQTAKFLLTANVLSELSNLVPTLTGLWDDIARNDGYVKRYWKSDGDRLCKILKKESKFDFEALRQRAEMTSLGSIGLPLLDLSFKVIPFYFYARTVIH